MNPRPIEISKASIPNDLNMAIDLVYTKIGFVCTPPIAEAESIHYGGHSFSINELQVKYRMAKITPTKTGQFVTLWKRNKKGPIEPFDISDSIDLFIISTRNERHFGQFIFPKSVLHERGILSGNSKEGKRAIRVYPPWDNTTSKQASKTQQWQVDYFLEIASNGFADLNLAKRLLS